MSQSVSVPLSPGQVAHFRALAEREAAAKTVQQERMAAALAVVLGQYSAEQVSQAQLHVDLDAQVVTFTPNEV